MRTTTRLMCVFAACFAITSTAAALQIVRTPVRTRPPPAEVYVPNPDVEASTPLESDVRTRSPLERQPVRQSRPTGRVVQVVGNLCYSDQPNTPVGQGDAKTECETALACAPATCRYDRSRSNWRCRC